MLTTEKMEEILAERKRVQLAIGLGLCPDCGGELEEFYEKYKPTSFWGMIFNPGHYILTRRCKTNHNHYNTSNRVVSTNLVD